MASKRNQRKTRRYAEAYKDVVTLPERVLENGLRASVQSEKNRRSDQVSNNEQGRRKETRIVLEDDFAVLSGSLPGAGAVVVPFWQLARIGDGAFHRLLQQQHA